MGVYAGIWWFLRLINCQSQGLALNPFFAFSRLLHVSSGMRALISSISLSHHLNARSRLISSSSKRFPKALAGLPMTMGFGESIPDEGTMRVMFDDSIIQDVAVEKAQDMSEVASPWPHGSTASSGMARTRKRPRRGRGSLKGMEGTLARARPQTNVNQDDTRFFHDRLH